MPSRRLSPRAAVPATWWEVPPTAHPAGSRAGSRTVVSLSALVACAALVLSGCGAGGSGPGSTGAPPGGGAVAGGGAPPASGAPGSTGSGERTVPWTTATGVPQPLPEPPDAPGIPVPAVTDPQAGQRERRLGWRLVSTSGTPAPSLVVETAAGGTACDTVTGVEVAETATSVTVTLWAGRTPSAGSCDGPQVAMARLYRIRVPLAAPLGSRSVLPGPVG